MQEGRSVGDIGDRISRNADAFNAALTHKAYEKAKADTKKMLEESTLNADPYPTSEDVQKEQLQRFMDERANEARARGVQEYLDSTIGAWSADRVNSVVDDWTDSRAQNMRRNAERVSRAKAEGVIPEGGVAKLEVPAIDVQLPKSVTEANIVADRQRADIMAKGSTLKKVSFADLSGKSQKEASKIVKDYLAENPHMAANKEMLENYVAGNIYNDTFKWKLDNDEQFFADAFEAAHGIKYKDFLKERVNEIKGIIKDLRDEAGEVAYEESQNRALNDLLSDNRGELRIPALEGYMGEKLAEKPYDEMLDKLNNWEKNNFASGVAAGFDWSDFFSLGLADMLSTAEMGNVLEKANRGAKLYGNEERLYELAKLIQELESYRDKVYESQGVMSKIGEGVGTTLEMLPEFALAMTGTGMIGSYAKLGGKAALKAALKAGGKELFKYGVKTTGKLGYNFGLAKVRGLAAAPFMPSTYNTYLDSLNSAYSFDDEGNLTFTPVDKKQAALGAWFSTANEISSEYLGAGIGTVVGWGARGLGRMVAGTKLAEAAVGVGKKVRKHLPKFTPQAKVAMRTLGVQADPVSETLSEALGDIMTSYEQAWIGMVVDKSQYGTMDYWMTLAGVTLAYGGSMAALGAVKSYRDVKKAVKVREDILAQITDRNLHDTLVAISTSDDVVLASAALADMNWEAFGEEAHLARAYVAADLNVKILEGAVEEESRLDRFRGTIEGVRNIVYQGKAGEYSDIIREAEMDGKKVYIINGYEANTNQYIVVDATTGEKTSVDKSKVKPTRELDVDTYIQETYKNTFSLEAEKQRVADVKTKALQLDNPTEKDVKRVASTLGIALPKVGNTVMLANGNMGAVTEVLSPTEYAVQDPSGATYKVHFTDILSTDKLTATAQGALARGEVAAPIAPVEETTQPTEAAETTTEVAETTTPDDNGITIGAEVTVDGRVGKVRARTQDGKYAVAFEAESGNYEDTEMEFFTGEELASLMGIAPMPTAEAPKTPETTTEVATTEDGSVDIEQMSAEDAAKALIQRAGTIEEAIAQVKQVIETVAEERKKTAKAEKKTSLNDIGKKSAELQALDTRLEFYGEVLGVLEGMLAEQQEQNMTEAQNIAEETGVAPATEETTNESESKPVEQPTSGLIRNGAEMKFTDNVIKMVDFVAKRLGITVEFVDGLKNEAGQPINGDITGKRVRISTSGAKGIKFIMGHEFFHRMKDLVDEQTYADFVKSIKEYAGEKAWKATMAHQRNVYRNHNARVAKEAMAKMTIDDVAKIAESLNINIEGLSLEDAKTAVARGAAMGKEQGIAEVNAIFPKMLSYDDALMVEECAADVAGGLVTNTNAFAKYVEDNSSNIPLVRGLRKAIRAMREFFDSFGYTDQQRKLNALEKNLASVLNEAAKKEAKAEKKPTTEGKTRNSLPSLVGVHNISLDKLRKVIKMGGLANPSVAVIDVDKQTHDDYGEYSLVLPKNMVDARQGKNAGTWAGDAWTPTYPSIIKRMKDDKSYSRFHKDIEALPEAMRNKVRLEFDSFMEGRSADPLAYWYLFEKGSAPELVLVPSRYSDEVANAISEATKGSFSMYGLTPEERAKCLEVYIAVKFNGDKTAFENDLQERIARLTETIETKKSDRVKKWAQSNIDAIKEYGFDYDSVADFIRDVQYDVREKGKVNEAATIMAAREQIKANNLEADYETWLNGLEERYGIEEYIFDGYTNSGNRRYLPHTVENASKWMKKQGRQGAVATFPSFGTFVAVSIPKMTTLESIRKRKALLGKSKEEYDAFREKWENVYYELGKKLQPDAKGFDDYGYWRLIEAVGHNNPKEFIKKQYNIELSEEDMTMFNDMVNAIRTEYPARYFETKFERPLQLNDFTAAVVPNDIPLDVESRLKDAGVEVIEYEKGDNASRAEAIQKASAMEGVRFSLIGEVGATALDMAEEATIRMNNLLSETEDVAREDQIFLREGAEMAMAKNVGLPKEEYAKLASTIMTRQHTYGRPPFDYAFTDGSFYVYDYLGDGDSIINFAMPIVGNEDLIQNITNSIDNGTITDTRSLDLYAENLQGKQRVNYRRFADAFKKRHGNRGYGVTFRGDSASNGGTYFEDSKRIGGDATTRGTSGNIDESANQELTTLYSLITPEMDADYLSAVERGDMETAQQMVMEAAKLAMPNTKVVDENGNPKVVYHGTPNIFTVFDKEKQGSSTDRGIWGSGFYFSESSDYAQTYAKRKGVEGQVLSLYLNLGNPLFISLRNGGNDGAKYFHDLQQKYFTDDVYEDIYKVEDNMARAQETMMQELMGNGYDGVVIEYSHPTIADEYVAFNPNQIKSADPVTYDDNGNVIPLSERFNPEKEDIRYSLPTDLLSDFADEFKALQDEYASLDPATIDYKHPFRVHKREVVQKYADHVADVLGLSCETFVIDAEDDAQVAEAYDRYKKSHQSVSQQYPHRTTPLAGLNDFKAGLKDDKGKYATGLYFNGTDFILMIISENDGYNEQNGYLQTNIHENVHGAMEALGITDFEKEMVLSEAEKHQPKALKKYLDGYDNETDATKGEEIVAYAINSRLNPAYGKLLLEFFEGGATLSDIWKSYNLQLPLRLSLTRKILNYLKDGYEAKNKISNNAGGSNKTAAGNSPYATNSKGFASKYLGEDIRVAERWDRSVDTRYHLPDPDPSDVFFDEIPIFDEQGNEIDFNSLTPEEAKEVLDDKVRQMLEAEYEHNISAIRKEAREARAAVNEAYREAKNKRRKGAKAARTNAARIDEIFGDTPFESLPYEVQALILIATGQAKIYWVDKGNKRGLASELDLTGSTGDRHAYRNIWGGAKKSFNEVVHDWWESLGGQERGIDDQDLRNALISALQSVHSSRDAMQEIINKYDDLAEDRDNTLAEIDRNEEKELREAKSAYEQHLANFELSEGEERTAYHDRAAQFFGNQSLSRVDDILEDLTNELERSKRKIERLKAEKKDVYTPLAESIQHAKNTVLRALERLRMFAGMEEVDLNDVARLINLVKASRSQRQIEELGAQATALVQRISIKKAKTNLMRLLSLKLSNTDIIHKMLKESDKWTNGEREAILKHLWKVSRNGLRVSKAVHPDAKAIIIELNGLVKRYKAGDDVERAKIIEEMRDWINPNADEVDMQRKYKDYAEKNKRAAYHLLNAYMNVLDAEVAYENATAKYRGRVKSKAENSAIVEAREDMRVKTGEYLNMLTLFNKELENLMVKGREDIRAFYLGREEHAKEIRNMGINAVGSDKARLLPDVNPTGRDKTMRALKRVNAAKNASVNAPYWTFDTVLNKIDRAGKNGKFYKYFMDKWSDSNADFLHRQRDHAMRLAEAMRKAFPKIARGKSAYDLFTAVLRKADETLLAPVKYLNRDREVETMRPTISSGMYILAMWRQPRYKASMEAHGITQSTIDDIYMQISEVDKGYIQFMDWVNDVFLPDTRLEYDVVHRALYGGSMAKEVNYFPANVLHYEEVKLDETTGLGNISLSPSALKERMSSMAMPNMNMNYFKVLQAHLQSMDQWASFEELRTDLSTLLSSKEFKNRLIAMQPGVKADGTGEGGLYENLFRTAKIATGLYETDYETLLSIISKAQQKWVAANIAYRFWTGLKQLSSIPIFAFYQSTDPMSYVFFGKALARGLNPYGAVRRAMNLSPSMRMRWESRFAGLDVLMQETNKEKGIAQYRGVGKKTLDIVKDFVATINRYGMTANAAMDVMACAVGVNMIYDYEIYKATGGKREATEAEKRDAIRKAEYAFNSTQQSSEGAYMSAMQKQPALAMYTVYKNASMAAHRKRSAGLEELWKLAVSKEHKKFLREELGEDGVKMSVDTAVSDLMQGLISDVGFTFMGTAGGMLLFSLLFGWDEDDDEDREEYWEAFIKDASWSMANGYAFGGLFGEYWGSGKVTFNPALEELQKTLERISDDKGDTLQEVVQALFQFGIGVDLKTFYNIAAGLENIFEEEDGNYSGAVLKFLNAPDRYVKAFVGDRREDETMEEYQTRIVRFYTLFDDVKYDEYFDEEGKFIGEDAPSIIMSKTKAQALRKEYEVAYRKDMLHRYGGKEAYSSYMDTEKKYKDICQLLGWTPDAKPKDYGEEETPIQYEMWVYADDAAYYSKNRKNWVGSEDDYYDLLMDEQKAKNELINQYYEYIKQTGLGAY